MRNRWGAVCYRCGKWCAHAEGHFERHNRRWRVQHAKCAIEARNKKKLDRMAAMKKGESDV